MSIKKKYMIVGASLFILLTGATIILASWCTRRIMLDEYKDKAELMLFAMKAVRKQVSSQIRPAAAKALGPDAFNPVLQSTSYTANQVFNRILPQYKHDLTFKTASIKPRNPKNKATPVEADIIHALDKLYSKEALPKIKGTLEMNSGMPFFSGVRNINGQPHYLIAVGEWNKPNCMTCHSTKEKAPKAMLALYPSKNDAAYGRKLNRVESAMIVSIPLKEVASQAWSVMSWVVGLCLSVLAIALLSLYWALKTIFDPVAAVTRVAKRIASGELASAASMLVRLKRNSADSGKKPESPDKRKDVNPLSRFISSEDEIGSLVESFSTMNENLLALMGRLQTADRKVSASASGIAASARELEATVSQQASSTNEVTATTRQISATAQDLVETMEQVAATVEETSSVAHSVREGISAREQTMRDLVKATLSISSRLSVINDKANNINSIITTIAKIADQTNLLSLNAAIEAEKAGEYGQGFSVVAREIRRLADQTVIAADDVEQMVKEMHGAVSSGVMEMDKFNEDIRQGVEEVVKIGRRLESMLEDVQALQPHFEQAKEGINHQAQSADQITEAMSMLSEAAMQTTDTIREFKITTERLNNVVQELTEEMDKFHAESDDTATPTE
ncbi:MAG: methyl-accepting chemotaxis protein [Desulfovibrionaceae bacterium]